MKKNIIFLTFLTFLFSTTAPSVFAKNVKGTFQDLIKKGTPMKCTYVMKLEKNKQVKGVVYAANKKFRSEIKMPFIQGKEMTTYMLSDGTTVYTWSSAMKQGTKFNIKEMTKDISVTPENQQKPGENKPNLTQKYQFKCAAWNSNASFFRVPTDINFIDFSAGVKGLMQSGEPPKMDCASVCQKMPEQVRQACLNRCK